MLSDFFSGTPPTGRMSPLIRCSADGAAAFQATLFVGDDEGGFGFQNYTSFDWVHPIFVGPILVPTDPIFTDPIFIPRWPIPLL